VNFETVSKPEVCITPCPAIDTNLEF